MITWKISMRVTFFRNPMAEVAYARGPTLLGATHYPCQKKMKTRSQKTRGPRKCGARKGGAPENGELQKARGTRKRGVLKKTRGPRDREAPQSDFITKMEL